VVNLRQRDPAGNERRSAENQQIQTDSGRREERPGRLCSVCSVCHPTLARLPHPLHTRLGKSWVPPLRSAFTRISPSLHPFAWRGLRMHVIFNSANEPSIPLAAGRA
jgi:hypothetical protein